MSSGGSCCCTHPKRSTNRGGSAFSEISTPFLSLDPPHLPSAPRISRVDHVARPHTLCPDSPRTSRRTSSPPGSLYTTSRSPAPTTRRGSTSYDGRSRVCGCSWGWRCLTLFSGIPSLGMVGPCLGVSYVSHLSGAVHPSCIERSNKVQAG